jgi:phenylacetate-CoA ligase
MNDATQRSHAGNQPTRHVEDARFAHLVPRMIRRSREYLDRQWSPELLRDCQRERLRSTLLAAVAAVPAYRHVVLDPQTLQDNPAAELAKFAPVDKAALQNSLLDYVADDFDPTTAFRLQTSGSTGVPLTLMHDEDELIEEAASFYRPFTSLSFSPGERVCRVLSDGERPSWGETVQLMPLQMELAVGNFLLPNFSWDYNLLRRLAEFAPVGLVGNPSDLLGLALLANERDTRLPSVRFLMTAGENLSPNTREVLQSTFRTEVRDLYSMQEVRNIAWECERGALHVNDDRVIVEAAPEAADSHEILITTLTNLTMPLIRYRTADLGHYTAADDDPCTCGRALGRLTEFHGRDRGFIVLPNGRLIGPKPMKLLLTGLPVATWQLIQHHPSELEIRLVARPCGPPPPSTAEIERMAAATVGGEIAVHVRWVDKAELLGTRGKFQMMHLLASTRLN